MDNLQYESKLDNIEEPIFELIVLNLIING